MTEAKSRGNQGKENSGVQSVRRAASLLRAVARHNENGIRLTPLCKDVGLKTATAHRLLNTLAEEGFVTHDPFSKRYNLGLELFTLGTAAHQFALRDYFLDPMERIAQQTEDTVFLFIRSGNSSLCLFRVEGKFPVRTLTVDVGARRPLGVGAGSLALMAYLPDDQVERIIEANADLYDDYNNQVPADMRRLVAQARELGYALSDRQLTPEVSAVGLPVKNDEGKVVAAISVAAIPVRMGLARREEIVRIVQSEVADLALPREK